MRKEEKRLWFWRGSYGGGPFTSTQMYTWYKDGYLRPNSIIRLGDGTFFKIKDLMDFANGRRTAPQRLAAPPSGFIPTTRYQPKSHEDQPSEDTPANQKLDQLFNSIEQPVTSVEIDDSKVKTLDEIESMGGGMMPPMTGGMAGFM